ncbi:DNA translocase FtsK [Methylomonas sp. LL1]|uniref:FtsK/SpoIIIE domain-containing protein n=1 Tax=Methylomonas sp. LL1 TaxID=2785785 RepID=UPI0018C353D3|nr:FtsK/SpoIIIE domain-containing protein [Methylomonas sp. LL1]QPK62375.1 DNA translocase FtsK [Methylomonas sp. LL1]
MADIYTSHDDENIIEQVKTYGFRTPKAPKYRVLRLALAKSLSINTPPSDDLDTLVGRGSEYSLEQVTGFGNTKNDGGLDFDDAIRVVLSVYHNEDLFNADARYKKLLQRHIRRGLREIRTSWNRGHSFIHWLREELISDSSVMNENLADTQVEQEHLEAALKEIGLTAEIKETKQGIRLNKYALYLANIHHLDLLKKGLGKLSFRLGVPDDSITLELGSEAGIANLYIPRNPEFWRIVPAQRLSEWAITKRPEKLPIWLGCTVLGDDFSMDLAEAPHILIAGATGSGKTVCLHSVLCSLLLTLTASQVQLALIDPKGTEFSLYGKLANLFGGKIGRNIVEAADILNALVDEMEARNQHFIELGVRNYEEASQKIQMPRIVAVVEELADLLMQSRDLETPLVRLAQKARSAGIHLILATQRPDSATFSGLLRSNIPVRIALRVQKHTESNIILDTKGAEALLGKGDMLVKLTDKPDPIRLHGAKLTDDNIAQAIAHYCR